MMSRNLDRRSVFRSICNRDMYQTKLARNNLIASTKDSLEYVQRLGLLHRADMHSSCVNSISWNSTGEYLLSGSDDKCVAITNPYNQQVLMKYTTAHRGNIFSARFMPQSNDNAFVSCAGDGVVLYTELLAPYVKRRATGPGDSNGTCIYDRFDFENVLNYTFNCHKYSAANSVLTVKSEPRSFMSCGEDHTVRFFDLRRTSSCLRAPCNDNILIVSPSAVHAMDLSPISNYYIAVGSSDSTVRIYDRRYLRDINFGGSFMSTREQHTRPVNIYPMPSPIRHRSRVTCVKYSPEETELLASFSSDHLYLFDLKHQGVDINEYDTRDQLVELQSLDQVDPQINFSPDWFAPGPNTHPDHDWDIEAVFTENDWRRLICRTMTTGLGDDRNNNPSGAREESPASTEMPNQDNYPPRASSSSGDTTAGVAQYMRMVYVGHCNMRTMTKEATFWGNDYVMSGSDCGYIFTWERRKGKLVMLMKADDYVVNCLQPHPELPYLASSGIENDIKIWAPKESQANFKEIEAKDHILRNAILLERKKNTYMGLTTLLTRVFDHMSVLENL